MNRLWHFNPLHLLTFLLHENVNGINLYILDGYCTLKYVKNIQRILDQHASFLLHIELLGPESKIAWRQIYDYRENCFFLNRYHIVSD
jgi:hypothetical protein